MLHLLFLYKIQRNEFSPFKEQVYLKMEFTAAIMPVWIFRKGSLKKLAMQKTFFYRKTFLIYFFPL